MEAAERSIKTYLISHAIPLTKETLTLIMIALSQLALVRTSTGSLQPGRIQLIWPQLAPPYPHMRARIESSLETLHAATGAAFTEILIAHEIITRASP
jgi:hypothetical protein